MPAATPITQAQIDALKTTLKANFMAGLALGKETWPMVAALIKSDSKSNTYAWLTQFPAFRKWVGARLHKAVAEKAYTVVNEKFEATIDVPRENIEDDEFGHFAAVASGAGQSLVDLKNDLIFQALADGFSSNCYDGQYFFDADHPLFPNEDGTGTATVQSNFQAGTSSPWILLCTDRAPKPLYLQERVAAQFDSQTSAASPLVYDLDTYSFGGRWRGNAAYGFWQCAFGSKADLTRQNFEDGYDAMMNFKGDGGRKLGITANKLVVGISNRAKAEAILKVAKLAGGADNTNYNRVELIVTPWMA